LNFDNKHIVYFLGIGGIGMSALARWFKARGMKVAGYDRTETSLTLQLQAEGIIVNFTDSADGIISDVKENKEGTLVIVTPAIPKDSVQLNFLINNGYDIHKRSEVLGAISKDHFTIAVAGTHGKTTTSSMIAHILHTAGRKMSAFLGGIVQNYNSNLVMDHNGSGEMMIVAEADEFDRSFLRLSPDIEVITAVDPDHLDIYGTVESMREAYGQFVEKIRPKGRLFVKKGIAAYFLPTGRPDIIVQEYNLDHSAIRAGNIRLEKEELRFDFISPGREIHNIPLSQPGFHNIENAVAAIAVCLDCGISEPQIKDAFSTYRGIKRRFEYIITNPEQVFIDDYAHHPEEIRAFLTSVKAIYPERNITAVFQPHLFSRTRDLAREFAESLSIADRVILLDIYPARELPIPGVTSELIFTHLTGVERILCKKEELLNILKKVKPDVLATIGAGDIDKMIIPIKKLLTEKE
jgi:UDP-N-acetylmuramate--alanine ligase